MSPVPGSEAPRVVEAGLRSFTCAYERYVEEPFHIGQVVAVREGPVTILGCIADTASGPEDPGRPLQAQGGALTAAEVFAENPHIRPLLRTRLTVVACGYIEGEAALALLPPAPPPLLARVEPATAGEVIHATTDGAFLALLTASPLCDDAVLAAALRAAASAHGPEAREFTVRAGKELARLLKAEPARLSSILRGVTA